jgi:hypothetical protein
VVRGIAEGHPLHADRDRSRRIQVAANLEVHAAGIAVVREPHGIERIHEGAILLVRLEEDGGVVVEVAGANAVSPMKSPRR